MTTGKYKQQKYFHATDWSLSLQWKKNEENQSNWWRLLLDNREVHFLPVDTLTEVQPGMIFCTYLGNWESNPYTNKSKSHMVFFFSLLHILF